MAPSSILPVALVLGAAGLYARAVLVLRRRRRPVPIAQQTAFLGGLALTAIALVSPLDAAAEDLLSAHMVQHLLIADLAAPLMLIGLRTPVLSHFLPPRVLAPLSRRRGLRRALRTLARPLVAIPVYALVLYAWHLGFLFEAAMRSEWVHALQHWSFVAISVLIWWAALEPNRGRVRGELWKIGHILGARVAGMMVGVAFIALRAPVYVAAYGAGERRGLDPLADQQIAGGLMLVLDVAVMLGALAFFFFRAGQDQDRADAEATSSAQTQEARTAVHAS